MFTPSKALMGLALALTSSAVLAYDITEGDFEILVAAGIASLDQDGGVSITPSQEDKLVQNDPEWDSWTAKLGVAYNLPLIELEEDEDEDDFQWFPDFTPQLNVYFLDGGDIKGDVYRHGDESQDGQVYSMDYTSTRLMFDVGLTIASLEGFSIYAIGGLGVSWNNADLTVSSIPGEYYGYHIEDSDSTTFAYEAGAGIAYDITDDFGISLEYLYANMGDVAVQGSSPRIGSDEDSDDPGFNAEDSDLSISSQSILLGLSFAL